MIRKILLVLCVMGLLGCYEDTNKELIRASFDAGWWCAEIGKSHTECVAELNNLPSMK